MYLVVSFVTKQKNVQANALLPHFKQMCVSTNFLFYQLYRLVFHFSVLQLRYVCVYVFMCVCCVLLLQILFVLCMMNSFRQEPLYNISSVFLRAGSYNHCFVVRAAIWRPHFGNCSARMASFLSIQLLISSDLIYTTTSTSTARAQRPSGFTKTYTELINSHF